MDDVLEFIKNWYNEVEEDINWFQVIQKDRIESEFPFPFANGIIDGRLRELAYTKEKLKELNELL